jgi:hypothetical protein
MKLKATIASLLVMPFAFVVIIVFTSSLKNTSWQVLTVPQAIVVLILLAVVTFSIILALMKWAKILTKRIAYITALQIVILYLFIFVILG